MTKNPFINALAALAYITGVASLMFYGLEPIEEPKFSLLIPIAMLSLFTLSAAVMGYIFLAQPVQMYLDGQKKHAVELFLQTIACFAGATLLLLAALFIKIF